MRLQSAVPLTEVQVLDTATAPIVPSSPNVPLTLALATLLGALLGASAAIWLEYRDPRVRSRGGVERLLGAPVIGRIALPVGQRTIANRNGGGPLLLEGRAA
jgi:succinoglycan biosynthesis transport protein ExoP